MTDVTVVIMTRDRADELLGTLQRLRSLPERPPIIVIDNGSSDGTPARVAERFPEVDLVPLGENRGVGARNLGVRRATTPYVAFNDDDSWWGPGSLRRVAELFDDHPALGLVTADIVVEPRGTRDPVSEEMRSSPVASPVEAPGIPVLGFLACAAAVRRDAFLEVGGFSERLHFAGEEDLIAMDLERAGWAVRFVPEVTVHHQASSKRDPVWRIRRGVRNALWTLWLRRPLRSAVRGSFELLREADPRTAIPAAAEAVRGLPWVVREREVVCDRIERELRKLEAGERQTRRHAA